VRPVDLGRVRRALAALAALVAEHPHLRDAWARSRLGLALDAEEGARDRGRDDHGDEEEAPER